MAKFPFTNFFDVNGNGQMNFSEELLAMKVFENALPGEEPALYDEMENAGLDGLDDGFSDEIDEENTDSLIDPDLMLHSPDFFDDDSDEEDDVWDDPAEDDEDVWGDPQEAPKETPVAYLTFSLDSQEERYSKQGIRREDYPNQRTYDAACELADLRKGEGYVPQNSTRQKEMEKRQFILSGSCVAARYLTINRGFLYAQAVKENFQLPIEVPDEDEEPVTSLEDLFLDLAEEDPALAVRVWAWIIREFGPYPQYMDGVWMPFNGLLHITDQFPPAFQELALEELCQNSDFRRGLLETSPEFPDVDAYIAYALSQGREDQAATLLQSALKNPHGKGVRYEELVQNIFYHIPEARDPEPWEALECGGVSHPGGAPRQAHPAPASPVEGGGGPAYPVEAAQAGAPAAPVRRPTGRHGQDRVHLLRGAVPRVAAGVSPSYRGRDAGCGGQSAGSRQRRPHRGRGRIH